MQTSGAMRRENAKICQMLNAVIASEAKQSILSLCRNVDCFAPLAMTWIGRSVLDTPHARGMTALCVAPRRDAALRIRSSFAASSSGFVLRNVLPEHALVALQAPFAIRPLGEPVGDANLRVDRAGAHGDAGLVAGGDDLFETELAVAENGDESDEHGDLR
jgi:hypothetical protein